MLLIHLNEIMKFLPYFLRNDFFALNFFFILSDSVVERAWEEIEIPVPWGKVAGKWYGSRNRQPIIALHGWQDNSGTFDVNVFFSVY